MTGAARLVWVAAALGAGCDRRSGELRVKGGLDRVGSAPLSRELRARTDVPTELRLRILGDAVDVDVTFPRALEHVVPVIGAKPDRDITVIAELTDREGRSGTLELRYHTPPLPKDFPRIALRGDPERAAPGAWLLPMDTPDGDAWFVALDPHDGEVVWSYTGRWNFGAVVLTDRGTLMGVADGSIVELDRLGRELRVYTLPARARRDEIEARGLVSPSHELVPLPHGAFATLVKRRLAVDAFPASYDDPTRLAPEEITDEAVGTFDADGNQTAAWWLSERLDTQRIGFDSRDTLGTGRDWAHPNAIVADPGGWLVSARHQDALLALDPAGEVRWILANPLGWRPEFEPLLLAGGPGVAWPLHQHGPDVAPDGTIVLFDNGNEGHTPYEPAADALPRSRLVAYRVDEAARTVDTAWTWEPPIRLYSPALGNVRVLPNGHVLATFGFVSEEGEDGEEPPGAGDRSIRVFELEPGVAEPVLDVQIWRPDPPYRRGVKLYRTIPVPSFYPEAVEEGSAPEAR